MYVIEYKYMISVLYMILAPQLLQYCTVQYIMVIFALALKDHNI